MRIQKEVSVLLFISFFTFLIASCKKEEPKPSTYPKQVSITYKVSSTTTSSAALVQYKNETGGNTDVPNAGLPFTKTITRTVNVSDILSIGFATDLSENVKLDILVDNILVKSQDYVSTYGAIIYVFP